MLTKAAAAKLVEHVTTSISLQIAVLAIAGAVAARSVLFLLRYRRRYQARRRQGSRWFAAAVEACFRRRKRRRSFLRPAGQSLAPTDWDDSSDEGRHEDDDGLEQQRRVLAAMAAIEQGASDDDVGTISTVPICVQFEDGQLLESGAVCLDSAASACDVVQEARMRAMRSLAQTGLPPFSAPTEWLAYRDALCVTVVNAASEDVVPEWRGLQARDVGMVKVHALGLVAARSSTGRS